MLEVSDIIARPDQSVLRHITRGAEIDIISPFYSGWSFRELERSRHSRVRFVTRLPNEFGSPPSFMDNDPRPLHAVMTRLGPLFEVYALPDVHAKLYLNEKSAWFG